MHPAPTQPLLAALLLASLAVGCAGQPAPPPEAPTAAPSAAERAALEQRCAELLAAHREVVEGAGITDPKVREALIQSGATCVTSGRAAWATVLTALTAQPGDAPDRQKLLGTRIIVHVQANGDRATLTPGPSGALFPEPGAEASDHNVQSGVYHDDDYALAVFDFDGDDDPEAVLTYRFDGHESASREASAILTHAQGAVAPYAPYQRFSAVQAIQDVNGDGRPDLLLASPWSAVEPTAMDGALKGPRFLAVSRPDGSFDPKAPTAALFMRAQCQPWRQNWHHGYLSLTLGPLDSDLNNEAFRTVLWGVACARTFGYSEAQVRKELEETALKREHSDLAFADAEAHRWNAIAPLATYPR